MTVKIPFPILLLGIIFLLNGCALKKTKIQEITPNIDSGSVFNFGTDVDINGIEAYREHIYCILNHSTIIRITPSNWKKDSQFQYAETFDAAYRANEGVLLLANKAGTQFSLFDLSKMKPLTQRSLDGRILYFDKEIHILFRGGRFHFFKNSDMAPFKRKKRGTKKAGFCSRFKDRIFIHIGDELHVHSIAGKLLRKYHVKGALPNTFLILTHDIYYFTRENKLVQLSRKNGKTTWSFQLPIEIINAPFHIDNKIGLILRDYNIYFFNRNGSLKWWSKLGAPLFGKPLKMDTNIAVALEPKKKPVFKFFSTDQNETTSYTFESPIMSKAYFQNNLYVVSMKTVDEKTETHLLKLGNQYKTDISFSPKTILEKGRSVRFDLKPTNLIDPSYGITILYEKEQDVFKETIAKEEQSSFFFFPEKSGVYELIVKTVSANRPPFETRLTFNVTDIKKKQYQFYHRILTQILNSSNDD